ERHGNLSLPVIPKKIGTHFIVEDAGPSGQELQGVTPSFGFIRGDFVLKAIVLLPYELVKLFLQRLRFAKLQLEEKGKIGMVCMTLFDKEEMGQADSFRGVVSCQQLAFGDGVQEIHDMKCF